MSCTWHFADKSSDMGKVRLLLFALLLAACTESDDALPPAGLTYPATELTLDAGQSVQSGKPDLTGTPPFTFSLFGNTAEGITIDEDGVITIGTGTAPGIYAPGITVSNKGGTRLFSEVISIRINAPAVLPTAFSYAPATGETPLGTAFTSSAPDTNGSGPLLYSLTSEPPAGNQLTIGTDGKIQAGNGLAAGTYVVSVQVSSSSGQVVFNNVFSLTVKASGTTASFQRDIKPILQQSCTGCHSNYSDYESVKKDADMIINRIQRSPGSVGFMPQGGMALTQAQIDLIKKWKDEGFAN